MASRAHFILATLFSCAATLATSASLATAQPVTLRLGRGAAAEEQFWLLQARPDLAPNFGKIYTIDMTFSPNPDKRFQAMQADALDINTSNSHSALYAAAAGLPLKIIASISRESRQGSFTRYVVKDASSIKTMQDLKGRTIGVAGQRSASHFWASAAVKNAGLSPQKDANFVAVQFAVQGEALRSGTIDVATLPQPYFDIEKSKGGIRTLFTSKDAVPFDEELIVLVARTKFLEQHADVARAFLSDLKNVTDYYLAHRREARQTLIDAKFIRTPPSVYLNMEDYYRAPDLRVDVEALKKAQDLNRDLGLLDKTVDIDSVVDLRFLPDAK